MSHEPIPLQPPTTTTTTATLPQITTHPTTTRHHHNPPRIHPPAPTYTHTLSTPLTPTTRLITIAGQVGITPSGTIPPTFSAQVSRALSNLDECLQATHCGKEDVVKVTLYIVGQPGQKPEEEEVRRELLGGFWGRPPPPNTVVFVKGLAVEGLLFEIEAMAVVGEGRGV